jgi:hypothetical protein
MICFFQCHYNRKHCSMKFCHDKNCPIKLKMHFITRFLQFITDFENIFQSGQKNFKNNLEIKKTTF